MFIFFISVIASLTTEEGAVWMRAGYASLWYISTVKTLKVGGQKVEDESLPSNGHVSISWKRQSFFSIEIIFPLFML